MNKCPERAKITLNFMETEPARLDGAHQRAENECLAAETKSQKARRVWDQPKTLSILINHSE